MKKYTILTVTMALIFCGVLVFASKTQSKSQLRRPYKALPELTALTRAPAAGLLVVFVIDEETGRLTPRVYDNIVLLLQRNGLVGWEELPSTSIPAQPYPINMEMLKNLRKYGIKPMKY